MYLRVVLQVGMVAASTERDRVDAGLIEGGYTYIGVELATHIRDVRAGVKVLQPVTEAQLFSKTLVGPCLLGIYPRTSSDAYACLTAH